MSAVLNLDARQHKSAVLEAFATRDADARRRTGRDVSNLGSGQLVRSSDPAVIELLGASPVAAGEAVTTDTAMRVSAVFACVRLLAGALGTLPLALYRGNPAINGQRQPVEDTNLWYLLNEQPTPSFAAQAHWEWVGAMQQLRGDSFTYIVRKRSGAIDALLPLTGGAGVTVEKQTADPRRLMYTYNDGLEDIVCDQDDMLHFAGFGFNGLRSLSVIQWAARQSIGTSLAMEKQWGNFFANGARPSAVLKTDKKVTDSQMELLQKQFQSSFAGTANAYRIPLVLSEGLALEPWSISPEDLQLIDARNFSVRDIARAFGVPPHMIGDTTAATSWGTGLESMNRAFVLYALQPHLRRIEQELNRKLFRRAGVFVEFVRDAMLAGDSKSEAEYYRRALGGPGAGDAWMSVDEVRSRKNLPPIGGEAATPYRAPDKQSTATGPSDPPHDPSTDPGQPSSGDPAS